MPRTRATAPPHIEYLRIRNFRALHDLELDGLAPLTVLLGPNGSGKSTIFDALFFLSECFGDGLARAWDRRGRMKELCTKGADCGVSIEIRYRETPKKPLMSYAVEFNENEGGAFVASERLGAMVGARKAAFVLEFKKGTGRVAGGVSGGRMEREKLDSPDLLAAATLGQFARRPALGGLRRMILNWRLSRFASRDARGAAPEGPQERLSPSGENLPNVIQYLEQRHAGRLREILKVLSNRIPHLESVETKRQPGGRVALSFKDAPFDEPISARFASEGTLKLLAYLTVLYDPKPPPLIGIEEPETHLHPRLLQELAEECRLATEHSQLIVSTHSPTFINGMEPHELWAIYRDEKGHTCARRASAMRGIGEFMEYGAKLGNLWMEGQFEAGDPLTRAGRPAKKK